MYYDVYITHCPKSGRREPDYHATIRMEWTDCELLGYSPTHLVGKAFLFLRKHGDNLGNVYMDETSKAHTKVNAKSKSLELLTSDNSVSAKCSRFYQPTKVNDLYFCDTCGFSGTWAECCEHNAQATSLGQ